MQKDFMAMAQGQQAPAAVPQQDETSIVLENIMQLGKESGIEQELGAEEFLRQAQELAKLIISEDQEGTENNKLYQILMSTLVEAEKMMEEQQPTGGPVPQQGAPKDFASMMPPTPGGGMGGR
jgi:hypothetical protein